MPTLSLPSDPMEHSGMVGAWLLSPDSPAALASSLFFSLQPRLGLNPMVLAQFVLIPSFSIQTKACEWGEVTIILMDLPVNARHLRALAGCSKGKRTKRDEAPKVTALDLEGISVPLMAWASLLAFSAKISKGRSS